MKTLPELSIAQTNLYERLMAHCNNTVLEPLEIMQALEVCIDHVSRKHKD